MKEITKPKRAVIPPKEKKAVKQVTPKDEHPFTAGDFVIRRRDGSIFKVGKSNKKEFTLVYQEGSGEWHLYGTLSWAEYFKSIPHQDYLKMEKSSEEYQKEAAFYLLNGFKDLEDVEESSGSTELVATADKTHAKTLRAGMIQKEQHLKILTWTLERMKNELDHFVSDLRKKIETVSRVVDIIEIYLGVHEKIVQIQEGEPAKPDALLCFRQLVLHMDEETGEDLDWEDVETFDDYFRKHVDSIFPEKKGVIVVRPRAADRNYCDNPLVNSFMNEGNKQTYVLIRNGDNLYRIWTSVKIYPHLFPSREEMNQLVETSETSPTSDGTNAKEILMTYQRNVLLLQGLIDRTDVLKPLPPGLNLLRAETYGTHVQFIYDGSNLLPSGRKSWSEYLQDINERTKRGDRMYVAKWPWDMFSKDSAGYHLWRFPLFDKGWREKSGPGILPKPGIYTVNEVQPYKRQYETSKFRFSLNWNPEDEIYNPKTREYYKRKTSIPFYLLDNDDFILNYENLSLEDLDFYINDRVNRRDYAKMMPVMRGIRAQRLQELEWENNFVKFLCGRIGREDTVAWRVIWDSISWWKTKVIDKRPLKKEDAKAVRMIEIEVKRRLKELK
jgi:hypothetical protein